MKEEKKEMVKKDDVVETRIATPAEMIKDAVAKGTDLDKLEKLLTLQERWEKNQALKAYNEAMAAFKADPPKIGKDRTVKYKEVKYNHASLYNVTEKINSALSKHGLSASWTTKQNGNIFVTCKITHKQGHGESTTLQAPADSTGSKNSIQAIGSTISYLQRYTLLSLTGLATHEQDNDAQSAPVECIDEKQQHEILDNLATMNKDLAKFCKAFGIEVLDKLPKDKFNRAILAINAKRGGKK